MHPAELMFGFCIRPLAIDAIPQMYNFSIRKLKENKFRRHLSQLGCKEMKSSAKMAMFQFLYTPSCDGCLFANFSIRKLIENKSRTHLSQLGYIETELFIKSKCCSFYKGICMHDAICNFNDCKLWHINHSISCENIH